MLRTRKAEGADAINVILNSLEKMVNEKQGQIILTNDVNNIQRELAVKICKDLGLVCGYIENIETDNNWTKMCLSPARARGSCMKHYDVRRRKGEFNEDYKKDEKIRIKDPTKNNLNDSSMNTIEIEIK